MHSQKTCEVSKGSKKPNWGDFKNGLTIKVGILGMCETMQYHSYNIGDNMVDSEKEKYTPPLHSQSPLAVHTWTCHFSPQLKVPRQASLGRRIAESGQGGFAFGHLSFNTSLTSPYRQQIQVQRKLNVLKLWRLTRKKAQVLWCGFYHPVTSIIPHKRRKER